MTSKYTDFLFQYGSFGKDLIEDLGSGVLHNHPQNYNSHVQSNHHPHPFQKRIGHQDPNKQQKSYNEISTREHGQFYPTKVPKTRTPFRLPRFPFVIAPFALFNPGGDPAEGFTLSPRQLQFRADAKDRKQARLQESNPPRVGK